MHTPNPFTISGTTLLPNGNLREAAITVHDGWIEKIQDFADPKADLAFEGVIVPGWIDLQINGGYGHDFTIDPGSADLVAQKLPETGVTGFLPTLITSEFNSYPDRLAVIRAIMGKQECQASGSSSSPVSAARILGVHLEGPFLNPQRPGAHPTQYLRGINLAEITAWAEPDIVRLVTLAAELPHGLEAIRSLRQNGIVVSQGHSDATYSQAQAGFEAGANWATHLFNAMRPLHHRQPGLIGATLENSVPCGMIVDGIHVHPSLVKLAYRMKGADGMILVTDAMGALGMPPGRYALGEHNVVVGEDDARLEDGTLAGSLLTMDQAVRNITAYTGCSLAEAVQMVSLNPARLLGLDHLYGKIAPGYRADLVVLNDQLVPALTLVAGNIVFQRELG